jgi:hypothetical protein
VRHGDIQIGLVIILSRRVVQHGNMQIGLVIILSRRVVQHGDMQIGLVIILSRRVVQHGDMQIGLVTYNFVAPCCVTWRDMKIVLSGFYTIFRSVLLCIPGDR